MQSGTHGNAKEVHELDTGIAELGLGTASFFVYCRSFVLFCLEGKGGMCVGRQDNGPMIAKCGEKEFCTRIAYSKAASCTSQSRKLHSFATKTCIFPTAPKRFVSTSF